MKLMFASDIHGDGVCCAKMLVRYKKEQAEKLILLGDLLYHGPRNDIPEGYAPKEVIELLNQNKEEILAVRGNCDAEVDQMVLEFPIMADYMTIFEKGRMFFITHGHNHNLEMRPMMKTGDLLIHGHTHVHTVEKSQDIWYLNPGSVSLPKADQEKSYMVYEDGTFTIKTLEGDVLLQWDMQ